MFSVAGGMLRCIEIEEEEEEEELTVGSESIEYSRGISIPLWAWC